MGAGSSADAARKLRGHVETLLEYTHDVEVEPEGAAGAGAGARADSDADADADADAGSEARGVLGGLGLR